MGRKNINKGKNLADQIRALLGSAICLLLFFAGMGLSYLILSINDNYTKAVVLIIHASVHLILMILAVVFTFIDQKRMLKQGKCIWLTENRTIIVWEFAGSTLVLALVLEALFLFINIAAAMDFLGRI
jgi:hypothetical protein